MCRANEFIKNIATKYLNEGEKLFIVSHYPYNDSPALIVQSLTGKTLLKATVCLEIPPKRGSIIIKNWSENEGIEDALVRANLISEATKYHYVTEYVGSATEHEMLNELKDAWEAHSLRI